MKKLTVLLIFVFISSCGMFKDVTKSKSTEKVKIVESISEWKRQQGETIILPYPKTPNKIYRDTIIKEVTVKGTTVFTSYDDKGIIDNQVVTCPDSEETKQTETKASYALRQSEMERKMDAEIAKVIGNRLVIIGFFFALACWLRGKS